MSGWDGSGAPVGGSADELVRAFGRWAADQRAEEAAGARSRERWLREQAAGSATFTGTLVDLAEQRADVAIVVGARTVTGRLVGVGRDGCVVAEASGAATVVPIARISALRLAGRRPALRAAAGERSPAGLWTVTDALEALAADRAPVRLGLRGGETLRGVVVAVGRDVVTLALDGMRALVPLGAVETASPT